jgi:hypothetical protein
MNLFAVRWPDGSFSVALAQNKLEAIDEFDKIDDTNGLELKEFKEFLATFKLTKEGEIELEAVDSDTRNDPVHHWAFPIWAEAVGDDEADIRESVRREMVREVRIAPKISLDPRVRALSRNLQMHPDLAEQHIRAALQRRLKKKEKKKN